MKEQSLGNDYYSRALPKNVFDGRIRVCEQAMCVIKDFLKNRNTHMLRCLDLGCSVGITTNYFSQFFKAVVGVDIDEPGISSAKKHYRKKNLSFFVDNANNLSFKKNTFDIIICQEVYEYSTTPQKVFEEIYRVLKPGGICYFAGTNLLYPVELQYHIPLIVYLPLNLQKHILKLLGHKKYYLGNFKTVWQLKTLTKRFHLHDYTIAIIKDPKKYHFVKLYKYQSLLQPFPQFVFFLLYYVVPSYIFILEKPKQLRSNIS